MLGCGYPGQAGVEAGLLACSGGFWLAASVGIGCYRACLQAWLRFKASLGWLFAEASP